MLNFSLLLIAMLILHHELLPVKAKLGGLVQIDLNLLDFVVFVDFLDNEPWIFSREQKAVIFVNHDLVRLSLRLLLVLRVPHDCLLPLLNVHFLVVFARLARRFSDGLASRAAHLFANINKYLFFFCLFLYSLLLVQKFQERQLGALALRWLTLFLFVQLTDHFVENLVALFLKHFPNVICLVIL